MLYSNLHKTESEKQRLRTKHIDLKYDPLRYLKEKNIIDIRYCSTEEITTDMFTTTLHTAKFDDYSALQATAICGCGERQHLEMQ